MKRKVDYDVRYVELILREESDRYRALYKLIFCTLGKHRWLESGECDACGFHRDGERVSA